MSKDSHPARKEKMLERARKAAEARRLKESGQLPEDPLKLPQGVTTQLPANALPDTPLEAFDYRFAPKKCTPELLGKFLNYFRETGIVTRSCQAVGICPSTIYRLRDSNPAFAELYDMARREAVDRLEEEARRRAFEGVSKPVFYKGQEVGAVQEYSDRLLEFLLTYNNPEKFGGNAKHGGDKTPPGTGGVQVQINYFSGPPPAVEVKPEGKEVVIEQRKEENHNAPIRVETPALSDERVDLHGTRREEGGSGVAPESR